MRHFSQEKSKSLTGYTLLILSPGSVASPVEPSPEPPPHVVCSSIEGACVRGSSPPPGPRLPFGSSFSLDELASFLFSAMEFCSVFLALQNQRNPRQQMPIRSV